MAQTPKRPKGDEQSQTIVKKYANRRLYNTATSSYVTLDELSQMVRDGEDFVVFDAKSGDDITRSVLTQIIMEEDAKGRNLLPISFLRRLIGFYDDSLHAFLPRYLEISMENFAKHQDQMREYVGDTFGRMFPISKGPINQFEDVTRQNMAMIKAATSMFAPFAQQSPEGAPPQQPPTANDAAPQSDRTDLSNEMQTLKSEMEVLKAQLKALTKNG